MLVETRSFFGMIQLAAQVASCVTAEKFVYWRFGHSVQFFFLLLDLHFERRPGSISH